MFVCHQFVLQGRQRLSQEVQRRCLRRGHRNRELRGKGTPPGARRQPNNWSIQANSMSAEETCQIDVFILTFKMKPETFQIL